MRGALLAAASIAVFAALVFARPHPTPGPPMRDFEAYYAAGTAWDAHTDPYSQAIWKAEQQLPGIDSARYEALPFIGPPAMLPFFALLARVPFIAANLLWRTILIAALGVIAFLTLRRAHAKVTAFSLCAISVAALGFGPLTSAFALGQIALPAFAFAVLALERPLASVFAWMQPNVALPLLSLIAERRGRFTLFASAIAFAAACALVAGASGTMHYAGSLHAHSTAERFSAIQITPAAVAYGFGAPQPLAIAVGAAVAAGALIWWIHLLRALGSTLERFCATCALVPLASPFFHEHDLLVLFVPGTIYAVRSGGRLWFLAAFAACFAATDWLGLAQRPDGTLQTLLLIAAFGISLIALNERHHPRMLVVPAAMLAVISIAALFAHAHPVPVWPDAMRALPAGAQNLDIASAWEAQQRATGLFAQNAVWAGLRALSLLGCALTALAITVSSRSPARSKNPLPAPA